MRQPQRQPQWQRSQRQQPQSQSSHQPGPGRPGANDEFPQRSWWSSSSRHFAQVYCIYFPCVGWKGKKSEMGESGVSYLEISVLCERWIGHRLLPEKTVPTHKRAGRILTLPPVCWESLPQLCQARRWVARFIPCGLGAHFERDRLRPISTSASFFFEFGQFDFGQFRLRPISPSANFDFGQFRLRPIRFRPIFGC